MRHLIFCHLFSPCCITHTFLPDSLPAFMAAWFQHTWLGEASPVWSLLKVIDLQCNLSVIYYSHLWCIQCNEWWLIQTKKDNTFVLLLFINALSIPAYLVLLRTALEHIPDHIWRQVGCTRYRLLIYHRGEAHTDRQPFMLESPIHSICLSLDCGSKAEHPEETHAGRAGLTHMGPQGLSVYCVCMHQLVIVNWLSSILCIKK